MKKYGNIYIAQLSCMEIKKNNKYWFKRNQNK